MMRSVRLLAFVLLAGPLAVLPAAVRAQTDRSQTDRSQTDRQEPASPTERLQEGAAAIVEGLRLLLDQLQSYQSPEVLPNGDIIIRRRPPAEPAPPKPDTQPAPESKPQPL